MEALFSEMSERAEMLCSNYVIPRVLKPISSAISSRS
jgi:hypothetical protein